MRESAPRLIEPTLMLADQFIEMAEEYQAAGSDRFALARIDFPAYLRQIEQLAQEEGLPPGYVPQNTYWLTQGSRILGSSRVRHRLTPALTLRGGQIGFDIRPSERRKGYGSLLLRLTLEQARQRGLRRVLITCDADNRASARIIEHSGGALENQLTLPDYERPIARYWIEL